jgi:hypothetical protein
MSDTDQTVAFQRPVAPIEWWVLAHVANSAPSIHIVEGSGRTRSVNLRVRSRLRRRREVHV